jgi:hypothetical protein
MTSARDPGCHHVDKVSAPLLKYAARAYHAGVRETLEQVK